MIWITPIIFPLLVALLAALPGTRGFARAVLVPLSASPALWLALFGPADGGAFFGSLVLGLELGFGEAGRFFLLFTSVLWLAAGFFSLGYHRNDPQLTRFNGFFLLTMTGNFGLILARDVPAFYTFFALMTFSAFGLVIHSGTAEAKRAARIYLITAVAGEALLLGAIFLAVGAAGSMRMEDLAPAVAASESRNLIMFLAFFGFGVKAGALPVHFWLPLAHPVAPVPASAVLSGAMIKAGLLGWLYFLPLGHGEFPGWGFFCITWGMAAVFGAAAVGSMQNDPKTMLAYSSISQMGVMTVVVGIGLTSPVAGFAALPVVLLYALNHALAKGALFFGAGIARVTGGGGRWLVASGLALPALAIAGAPWTGGSMVKYMIKDLGAGLPGWLVPWIGWLLPLSSAATALLLGRFLWLIWWEMRGRRDGHAHPSMWLSWLLLLAGGAVAVIFAVHYFSMEIMAVPGFRASIWSSLWPILLGIGSLLLLARLLLGKPNRPTVPAGDLLVVLEWLSAYLRRASTWLPVPGPSRWGINLIEPLEHLAESERRGDLVHRVEERLRYRSVPGVLFMLLALGFIALLIFGTPIR